MSGDRGNEGLALGTVATGGIAPGSKLHSRGSVVVFVNDFYFPSSDACCDSVIHFY